MQSNGAPILPSAASMTNPPGFQYTPNVNGQFVVAPPGHPAHSGVPAGYQYPPGAVPVAGGAVEVPGYQPQVLAPTQATYTSQSGLTVEVPTLVEVPLAAIPDNPADLVMPEPEKPKRTRRTKAEIEAEAQRRSTGVTIIDVESRTIEEHEPQAGGLGLSVEEARARYVPRPGIDGAVETLAARSKELGCDIQVNIVMKGGQS